MKESYNGEHVYLLEVTGRKMNHTVSGGHGELGLVRTLCVTLLWKMFACFLETMYTVMHWI